jgi:hypothetical protein
MASLIDSAKDGYHYLRHFSPGNIPAIGRRGRRSNGFKISYHLRYDHRIGISFLPSVSMVATWVKFHSGLYHL